MILAITSDLHCDHNFTPIEWPEADILVIAGDTANNVDAGLGLFHEAASRYRHVVTLDGNHEHWFNTRLRLTIEENLQLFVDSTPDNVHVLGHHMPSIELEGVVFIGANGWYTADMMGDPAANREYWKEEWADARFTGFVHMNQYYPWTRAEKDARLVGSELDKITDASKPVVVVTHTVPHTSLLRKGAEWAYTNNFFVSTYMHDLLESERARYITHWIYGHTHDRGETMINNVHMIANPRGKVEENPTWFVATQPIIM